MPQLKRRQFLQFAASALATLGISQLDLNRQGLRYARSLAQSTPRKLALLVGINDYPNAPLEGCLNDIDLQRELLINRFGFNKDNILTLTDGQATRAGILQAFEEHLIKQAKPNDVVVFHYSGHGSRVFDQDPIVVEPDQQGGLNSTFVPADAVLPPDYPEQGGVVKDIMGHTLFLLMSACQSEHFTAVLDSCFSGGAARKFRVRSRDGGRRVQISDAEKSYQQQWLSKLKWSREELVRRYRAGVAKGVVIAATSPEQLAIDAQLNGFHAGLFSYLLTQYLWQQTGTPESAVAYIRQQIPEMFDQTPRFEVKASSRYEKQPIYFINSPSSTANAVITEVKGKQVTLWLGGVDPASIDSGTVFNIVGAKERSAAKVTLQSRDGLVGVATVEGIVNPGALLRVTE